MCTYGIQFITIPSLNESVITSRKNMQLCKLFSLLTQVQGVWQIFTDATTKNDDWYGRLLELLTKKCFHQKRSQNRKYPFKHNQLSSSEKMRNKILLYKTMTQYLNNFNDIHCIKLDDLENDLSTGDEVSVVVLYI